VNNSEKVYTNGEITVIWKSGLCRHSGNCVRGLGEVFNVHAHPWIDMSGAPTERISGQVEQCPSGALTFIKNEKAAAAAG
jgi:uncharacterized Fe-S cluster protein YjdI